MEKGETRTHKVTSKGGGVAPLFYASLLKGTLLFGVGYIHLDVINRY
ncbi:hypothetical protein SAMN05428961_11164 [Paenibacillus sp. OK060]|nr:hypothetical protein SAMN05428961_11164 [Paenibacillus sp. OK060]